MRRSEGDFRQRKTASLRASISSEGWTVLTFTRGTAVVFHMTRSFADYSQHLVGDGRQRLGRGTTTRNGQRTEVEGENFKILMSGFETVTAEARAAEEGWHGS